MLRVFFRFEADFHRLISYRNQTRAFLRPKRDPSTDSRGWLHVERVSKV